MAISLASVAIVKSALNVDVIANNSRVQAMATEAAQTALRFCERRITFMPAGFTIKDAPVAGHLWTDIDNWNDANNINQVPLNVIASDDSAFRTVRQPECMVEYFDATETVVIVTARGFSPNYLAANDGTTARGAVIWLQSILSVVAVPVV